MSPESNGSQGVSLEHACTTMGVVVALAGLLAMLASAFGCSPTETMSGTWRWCILLLAVMAHRVHRWIAPLFWPRQPVMALHHDVRDQSVRA